MCIYIYVCMYACMHVCMYVYTVYHGLVSPKMPPSYPAAPEFPSPWNCTQGFFHQGASRDERLGPTFTDSPRAESSGVTFGGNPLGISSWGHQLVGGFNLPYIWLVYVSIWCKIPVIIILSYLTGWWFQPTPLKNMSRLGWWLCPTKMAK